MSTDRDSQAIPMPPSLALDVHAQEAAGLFMRVEHDLERNSIRAVATYHYRGETLVGKAEVPAVRTEWRARRAAFAALRGEVAFFNGMARLAAIGAVGANANGLASMSTTDYP